MSTLLDRDTTPEALDEASKAALGWRTGYGFSSSPHTARRRQHSARRSSTPPLDTLSASTARDRSVSPVRERSISPTPIHGSITAPYTPSRRHTARFEAPRRRLFDDMTEQSVWTITLTADWRRRSEPVASTSAAGSNWHVDAAAPKRTLREATFDDASDDSEPDSPRSKRSRPDDGLEAMDDDQGPRPSSAFAPSLGHWGERRNSNLSLAGQLPSRPPLLRHATSVSPPEIIPSGPLYRGETSLPVPIPRPSPIRFALPRRSSSTRDRAPLTSSSPSRSVESPGERLVRHGAERAESLRPAREALAGSSLFAPLRQAPITNTHRAGALGMGRMRGPTAASNERWLRRAELPEATGPAQWSGQARSSGDVEGLPSFLRDEADNRPLASGSLARASMNLIRRQEGTEEMTTERTASDFFERLAAIRRDRRTVEAQRPATLADVDPTDSELVRMVIPEAEHSTRTRPFEVFRRRRPFDDPDGFGRVWPAAPFYVDADDLLQASGFLGDYVLDGPNDYEALTALTAAIGNVIPAFTTAWAIEETERLYPDRIICTTSSMAKLIVKCSSADRCHICLTDYEADSPVRVLPCRHAFDRDCADRWLTQGVKCMLSQ